MKYYLIYFDVQANPGVRTVLNETYNLSYSETLDTNESNIADGWWSIINEPIDYGFGIIDDPIQINVSTVSIADNVSAFVYLDSNISHNFTTYLLDAGDGIDWISNDIYFDSEGTWTIQVNCKDAAGFEALINEHNFYVGKPDFEITDISFRSNFSEDKIYVEDDVNISVSIAVSYTHLRAHET